MDFDNSSSSYIVSNNKPIPDAYLRSLDQGEALAPHHYYYSYFEKAWNNNNRMLRKKPKNKSHAVKTELYIEIKKVKYGIKREIIKLIRKDFASGKEILFHVFDSIKNYGLSDFFKLFPSMQKLDYDILENFSLVLEDVKRNLDILYQRNSSDFVKINLSDLTASDIASLNGILPRKKEAEEKEKGAPSYSPFDESFESQVSESCGQVVATFENNELVKLEKSLKSQLDALKLTVDAVNMAKSLKIKGSGEKIFFEKLVVEIKNKKLDTMTPLVLFFKENKILKKERNANIRFVFNLLREQKRHVFARFQNISIYYGAFVRRLQLILKEVEVQAPSKGKGLFVQQVVIDTLQTSYPKDKSDTAAVLSVLDNHHEEYIMGFEKEKIPEKAKKRCAVKNDFLLRTVKQLEYQRAHTLPFPAMFNWKEERLSRRLGLSPHPTTASREFAKQAFLELKEDPVRGDEIFKQELEEIKSTFKTNVDEFIYEALYRLKWLHLKLHSETEYMPQVVNHLDTLCEWALTKNHHYSQSIATAVINLIQQDKALSEDEVWEYFAEYRNRTLDRLKGEMTEWEKKNSLTNLFFRVGALQIQQAILASAPPAKRL